LHVVPRFAPPVGGVWSLGYLSFKSTMPVFGVLCNKW
jgi:hypothetical protein